MIEKTYKCDLCFEISDATELHGIYWHKRNRFTLKPALQTERHLCKNCIESLRIILGVKEDEDN